MLKKLIIIFFILLILGISSLILINSAVQRSSKDFISHSKETLPSKYTCIVLGAFVGNDGTPSTVLADRLNAALELYMNGKVKCFLLTGDHGHKNYDEVNNMKAYLQEKGVPLKDIFLDHAGFGTYNSMVRAKQIFLVNEAIIVTQEFHLNRAIYIARKKGIDAYDYTAAMSNNRALGYLKFRESIARLKAFWEVSINKSPRFLGTKIPITGDSRLSYD
jgi:SanA protein